MPFYHADVGDARGLIRLRQLATGVDFTIVNGHLLIEDGEHTGAYPGRVVRSRANARVPA